MTTLPKLHPGDFVEIIAPASRFNDDHLEKICTLLQSWGLKPLVNDAMFGNDLLCANSDARRFELLSQALLNQETKAVICGRGGYGSARLVPMLETIIKPQTPKWFLGMSDITAMHLYLQQQWQWPTLHASLSPHISVQSLTATKEIVFGEINEVKYDATPLNSASSKSRIIEASIVGGNLSLLQTSVGTSWEINAKNKILFIEEISERGYRIDRMLTHLQQAGILNSVSAIIFGDFLEGNEPDGSNLIWPVIKRFAESSNIPMLSMPGIGHGSQNYPLLLNFPARLSLGVNIQLSMAN